MAEFTSLNGFMVKDETARNIAKGRNQAVAYSDYATMIEALNEMEKDEFKTGQNIYIGTVGVPDLWVYSIEDIKHTFTYVSDENIAELLKSNVTIQAGFFRLAMLEGQKVDLTTVNEQLAEHEADITKNGNDISALNQNMGGLTFGKDGDGNYGYYGADGSLVPFKKDPVEFEIFALFFNNIELQTPLSGINIYLDFTKVKNFTIEFTTKNMGMYIRYFNSSGNIVNIWGTNYSGQGATANVSKRYTITVDCEQYNFNVGAPVFLALMGADGVSNIKIPSYELK